MKELIAKLAGALKDARVLVGLGVVVGATVLLSAGMTAHASAAEARALRDRITRTADLATRARTEFVPATTAESDTWERLARDISEFGVRPGDRFDLATLVARIAEVYGMSGVRVEFIGLDQAGAPGERVVGAHRFKPASYALSLRGNGSAWTLADVLANLPASVEPRSLSISGGSISCVLVAYEVAS